MKSRLFAIFLAVLVTLWLVSSCMINPLGMTTRTTIRSQTAVRTTQMQTSANMHIAEVEADAQIRVAEAEADAKVRVAEAESHANVRVAEEMADATKFKATEQRRIHQTWSHMLQMLALIVSLAGCIGLALLLCTKLALQLMKDGLTANVFIKLIDGRVTGETKRLSCPAEDVLAKHAARHNQYVRRRNGQHLLIDRDTDRVVKRLIRK